MLIAMEANILELAKIIESVREHYPSHQIRLVCKSPVTCQAWLRDFIHRYPDQQPPIGCTMWELAAELAEPWITQQQLKLLSPGEQESIIGQVWQKMEPQLSARSKMVIGSGAGYVRVLQSTVQELRLAGIDAEALDPDSFPVKERGRFLRNLLEQYERCLKEARCADPASVLMMARDRLLDMGMLPRVHLVLPQTLRLTGLLQSVFDQIPTEHYSTLRLPFPKKETDQCSDLERLAWLGSPTDAPRPKNDQTVSLYRALNPEYEVRAVLGTILRDQLPFDQVEVLYSDETIYPALFYSLAASVRPDANSPLPLSFGGGVPVAWTRPGRAVRFWLDWVQSQFHRSGLSELLAQDLILLSEAVNPDDLLPLLQQSPEHTGTDAWMRYLEHAISKPETSATERAYWTELKSLLSQHFKLAPQGDAEQAWKAIETFLTSQAKLIDDWDHLAQADGLKLIEELRKGAYTQAASVWERMRHWSTEAHLPAEGATPSAIQLMPISRQETVRRPWTFCLGLSDDLYPSLPTRESLLTDRERKGISPELALGSTREILHQQNQAFVAMLGELHGSVVFSYSCADQVDDREQFPSQLFMQVFRMTAGLPEGDLHDLETWLQAPLGPGSPLCRITKSEKWLNHMPDRPYYDALFRQDFPLLCRGAFARKQRSSYAFTEFDGAVAAAGVQFDLRCSNPVFSAHALQQYARCPLQFFYQHVLKINPVQTLESEPGRWLHPLVRGVVLHTVFHQFHVQLQREKRRPRIPQDGVLLKSFLQETLGKYEDALPVVSFHVRQSELNELHETLNIFLGEETQWAERYVPRYFETGIGMKSEENPTVMDTPEPVSITLPSGRAIAVQGRIDRIDEVLSGANEGNQPTYFVWDYKTGRMKDYQGESVRRTGQLLQPLLYLELVEKRLRQVIDQKAVVSGAGYFFPGHRGGQGDRLEWSADDLRKDKNVLDTLLDLLQTGVFLATDSQDVCTHCDFRDACDVPEVNKQAMNKEKQSSNTQLRPLYQLRRSP